MRKGEELSGIVEYLSPGDIRKYASELSPQEQEVLKLLNDKAAAAVSLDSLMRFVFDAAESIFPCDRLGLAFLDNDRQRIVSRLVLARYSPTLLRTEYSEGKAGSSLEDVLESGAIRIIYDLEKYLEVNPSSRSTRLLVKEGVRSSMTCPLYVDGRVVGLLFRSSRSPNSYSAHQAVLHYLSSERLSQAVEKTYRIDRLESANNAYLELLSFASHELRSPLASLIMDCDLLTDELLGPLTDKQKEKIGRIKTKGEDLLSLTKDYLDLSSFESGGIRLRIKDGVRFFDDVVRPVLHGLKPQIEEQGIGVELQPDSGEVLLDADEEQLKVVLTNLLSNAVKYGSINGRIKITAGVKNQKVLVSVWNTGTGFPVEMRDRLFRRFSRLSIPEFSGIRGSGVGLYNAWRIVQLHGGRMDARSEYGSWAEFSFEIPQRAAEDE